MRKWNGSVLLLERVIGSFNSHPKNEKRRVAFSHLDLSVALSPALQSWSKGALKVHPELTPLECLPSSNGKANKGIQPRVR
jgi:hypothetical protein